MDSKWPVTIRRVGTIAALVFLLALFIIFHAYTLSFESYWYDELFTIEVASLPDAGSIWNRLQSDTSPPLFFWSLHYFMPVADSMDLSYRWLSVFAAIAAMAGIYLAMRQGFKNSTALLALIFLTVNPFWLIYCQELRMYTMYPAFLWLGWAALLRAIETGRKQWWFTTGLLGALALWTHYHAAFFLLVQYGALLYFALRIKNRNIRKGMFLSMTITCLFAAPLLGLVIHQVTGSLVNVSWLETPGPSQVISNFMFGYLIFQLPNDPIRAWLIQNGILWFFAILALSLLFSHVRTKKLNGISFSFLLAFALLPPILMILFSLLPVKFYTFGRYSILSLGPFCALLAWLIHSTQRPGLKWALSIFLILLCLQSWPYILKTENKDNWPALTKVIDENVDKDDNLVAYPTYWANGYDFYSEDPVTVSDFNDLALQSNLTTDTIYFLIYNLAQTEDIHTPWLLLDYMHYNADESVLYQGTLFSLIKISNLDFDELRAWYLKRKITGREKLFALNPLFLIGAEDLPEFAHERGKFDKLSITGTGELYRWSMQPPLKLTFPVTIPPGKYSIKLKVSMEKRTTPPPNKLTVEIEGSDSTTIVLDDTTKMVIDIPITISQEMQNPTFILNGEIFRPSDHDPQSTDDRLLFLPIYWIALVPAD